MAFQINAGCIRCWACVPLCPNGAIATEAAQFRIEPNRCTECVGDFAEPQCASICPVEEVILDAQGEPLNPAGSLTGIPPERRAAVMAEIGAR